MNVDGPRVVDIQLDQGTIGSVSCGETVVISPGDPGIPGLPWTVRFLTPEGMLLGTVLESEQDFKPFVTIREGEVFAGDMPGVGPAPIGTPCA